MYSFMSDPKNNYDDLNDSDLGGIAPAEYDINEEYGLLTSNTADSFLNNETDEWGY